MSNAATASFVRSHFLFNGDANTLLKETSGSIFKMDTLLLKQIQHPLTLLVLLTACLVAAQRTTTNEEGPVAHITANQTLRGHWLQTIRKNRQIAAFVGIPYAEAPVGELRFNSPKEPKNWSGELKLTAVGTEPLCPQLISGQVVGEEDCLKLNVFTPQNANNLPILVWLHGGGFMRGGAKEYGPQVLLDRDVIVVTLNYRLGPLGFLSTEDETVPGNWGLKDQLRAIQWVHAHAGAFGGDPKRITVGGVGAGGVSAHLHTMSQLSRRLLHGVISMSGTALRPDVPTAKGVARRRALRMAERLGCVSSNLTSVEAVGCLRKATTEELLTVDSEDGWTPVVEDYVEDIDVAFLEESPATTLVDGMTHDLPWLTGFTKTDGRDRAPGLVENPAAIKRLGDNFNTTAGDLLGYASTAPDPTEVSCEVRDFYFEYGNLTQKALEQMLLDAWYLAPVDEAVRLHAAHSPAATFLYLFTGGKTSSKKEQIASLFPVSSTSTSDASTDIAISELVLDLWTSFISKGVPTTDKSNVEWKKAASNDLEFIEIAENGKLLQGKGLLGHRAHFWSSLPRSDRHAKLLRASIPLQSKFHNEL